MATSLETMDEPSIETPMCRVTVRSFEKVFYENRLSDVWKYMVLLEINSNRDLSAYGIKWRTILIREINSLGCLVPFVAPLIVI